MNNLKLLLSFLNPALIEFAKHVDYVHILDDEGDLVVIFGRYKKNPDSLTLDCIKAIQASAGGALNKDENGRTVLTIIVKRK